MRVGDLDWYGMVEATITTLYRQELGRDPDDSGRGNLLWMAREHGATADRLQAFLRESAEYRERHASKPPPVSVVDRTVLKGAFCIPTRPRRVWWPAFLAVDDAEQDRYIAETTARGYTF